MSQNTKKKHAYGSKEAGNSKKGKVSSKNEMIYGILPVLTALQHKKRRLDSLYVKTDAEDSLRLKQIISLAEEIKLPINEIKANQFRDICPEKVHQGVVLNCGPLPYSSFEDMLKVSGQAFPLIVALDQIEDPHNMGAVIRSCGFFGVSAVVVPQDHSSSLTAVVSKSSAGVAEWFPVIAVPNLSRFIQSQKQQGYWVVGLDGGASASITDLKRDRPLIIVMGNEGRGMRPLIRKNCDWNISIPGNPDVSSLNVSTATSVVLYHLHFQSLQTS